MPAKTRTKFEREKDILEIEKLDHRGYSKIEISRQLGLTKDQVSRDLNVLAKRYEKKGLRSRHYYVLQKLYQLREARKELFEAWERSKTDKEKFIEETTEDAQGNVTSFKKQRILEGRLPDPAYQKLINDNLKAERELLGLDAAVKIDTTVQTIDWTALLGYKKPDPIESRIKEVEMLPDPNVDECPDDKLEELVKDQVVVESPIVVKPTT